MSYQCSTSTLFWVQQKKTRLFHQSEVRNSGSPFVIERTISTATVNSCCKNKHLTIMMQVVISFINLPSGSALCSNNSGCSAHDLRGISSLPALHKISIFLSVRCVLSSRVIYCTEQRAPRVVEYDRSQKEADEDDVLDLIIGINGRKS